MRVAVLADVAVAVGVGPAVCIYVRVAVLADVAVAVGVGAATGGYTAGVGVAVAAGVAVGVGAATGGYTAGVGVAVAAGVAEGVGAATGGYTVGSGSGVGAATGGYTVGSGSGVGAATGGYTSSSSSSALSLCSRLCSRRFLLFSRRFSRLSLGEGGSHMVPWSVTPNAEHTHLGHGGNQVGGPGFSIVHRRQPLWSESTMHPAPPSRQLSTYAYSPMVWSPIVQILASHVPCIAPESVVITGSWPGLDLAYDHLMPRLSVLTNPDDAAHTAATAATPSTTPATETGKVEPREDVLPSSSGARSSAGRAPIGGAAMVREFITEFTRRMQRERSRK